MAVANTKSLQVTNGDAVPRKSTGVRIAEGRLKESTAFIEMAAGDDDGSVYRMHRVRSDVRISSLEVGNDAVATELGDNGTDFDMGVYQTAENGGAVLDADVFASAVDITSALPLTDYTYEAGATDIDKISMPLWERLGLSANPGIEYDIALTGNTVGAGAGTIVSRLRFVDGT